MVAGTSRQNQYDHAALSGAKPSALLTVAGHRHLEQQRWQKQSGNMGLTTSGTLPGTRQQQASGEQGALYLDIV